MPHLPSLHIGRVTLTRDTSPAVPVDALFGHSAMGALCRATDWASTPLGPIEGWPQSLRTAAAMVLHQGMPQALCWGPELRQVYNDGYRVILGPDKHPGALGQPVLETWAEIRDDIAPLFARVMAGETVYHENLHLRVNRRARMEDAWFTFSYSPVIVESGEVGAALVNCVETTDEVAGRAAQAERDGLLEALRVEQARLEGVFRQSPSFLAILRGPDNVFDLINDAYEQMIGHGRHVVGRALFDALPETRGQGFEEYMAHVRETGEPLVFRELAVMLERTPGAALEQRFIDITYLPLMEPDGTHPAIIAHGHDVTEQVMARREIERLLKESEAARTEAEQANRAKSQFLAAMSHELRTPLNAIGGYVDLLSLGVHGPLGDAQLQALERVTANQKHLLTLINEILTFARLEAGRTEFDLRALPVRDLLRGVEQLVAPLAHVKRIRYTVHECDESLRVRADDERVRQVLINLVSNAIKFTAEGGEVRLSCEARDGWVDIHVRDNGMGIAPEKLQSIFDPFTQVGRALNQPAAGVGLGLAISRDLARGMGGDVSVASEPGAGSAFTLTLPAPQAP